MIRPHPRQEKTMRLRLVVALVAALPAGVAAQPYPTKPVRFIAPFIGAAAAIGAFGESPTTAFWLAAALMGAGVWMHLTERHEHEHAHQPLEHVHTHEHGS
jgi:drug/metabolite transporter (DMT)-like permease